MKYLKLYQTEWNSISLVDIAKDKGVNEEEIASSDFYSYYYERIKEHGYKFEDEWVIEKRKIGAKIYGELPLDARIISLGCGTGICEENALKSGYNIEMQECQEISFDYLERKGVSIPRKWVSNDIGVLPSDTYDVVVVNHVVYVFNDSEYINFIENIRRILKTNGKLILITENLTKIDIVKNRLSSIKANRVIRKLFGKSVKTKGVFWGYLRTLSRHRKLLKHSFSCIDTKKVDNFLIHYCRL